MKKLGIGIAVFLGVGMFAHVALFAAEEDFSHHGRMKGRHGGGGHGPFMGAVDADKNGAITAEEFDAFQAKLFSEADTDGDGSLSEGELTAHFAAQSEMHGSKSAPRAPRPEDASGRGRRDAMRDRSPEEIIGYLDKDDDAMISREEAPEPMQRRFDRLDANEDGSIDASELQTMQDRMAQAHKQGRGQHMMERADKNKDGKIQENEAPKWLADKFGELDENGDGELEEKELAQLRKHMKRRQGEGMDRPHGERGARMFEKRDANGDGMLQKEELPERMQDRFEKLDKNADGSISKEELKNMRRRMDKGGKKGKRDPARMSRMFEKRDTNGDGILQIDEAPEPMKEHFEMIDQNGDGGVSPEELRTMHEMRSGKAAPILYFPGEREATESSNWRI